MLLLPDPPLALFSKFGQNQQFSCQPKVGCEIVLPRGKLVDFQILFDCVFDIFEWGEGLARVLLLHPAPNFKIGQIL